MNAFDFMGAFGGIAPEKVQAALESMGYIPVRKKAARGGLCARCCWPRQWPCC